MPNDGQNRSLRSLFWPSCAGFHPELSAAARSARDIGHLRVCAAHSSSLNPFVKKMQAFSMTQGLRKPGARYQKDAAGWRTSCAPIKTRLRAELKKQLELWVKGLNLNHTGGKRLNYPWLDEYLLSKKSATKDFKVEWQWDRYQIGNKLFAAICYGENDKQILTV